MTNKYLSIGLVNMRQNLTYFSDFAFSTIFIMVILYVYSYFWRAVYTTTPVQGYTIIQMLWYLVFTEALVVSPRPIVETITNEVQNGEIVVHLIRPYNYILHHYAFYMSGTLLKFPFYIAGGALVVTLTTGTITIIPAGILPLIISALLSFTLSYVILATIGLLAFWTEDARPIEYITSKLVFILGGMLVPIDIFPQWIQNISQYLPFIGIAYLPAKLALNYTHILAAKTMLLQIFWIGIITIILFFVYKKGVKKVVINGG